MPDRREGSGRWSWPGPAVAGEHGTTREVSSMIRRAAKDVDEANARLARLIALRDSMRRLGAGSVGDLPDSVRAKHRGAMRDPRWI